MNSNYELIGRIFCDQAAIRSVRFSEDGEYCITCGSNKKIKLWNPFKKTLLKTYNGHANDVLDSCSSCDQGQIASCSVDKSVILWDVVSATPLRRFRAHSGPVTTVRFNELSTTIVSGSQDNSVMIWDVRSRASEPIQVLSDAKDTISSVRVSNHEILSASYDASIRRYDIRSGQLCCDYIGEVITCANFTRDNHCVLVSCSDGIIKLMDKENGELLGEYIGLKRSDLYLESNVNFNDTLILSGSNEGQLWMWNLMSRETVEKLSDKQHNKHPLTSLAVHPKKNCFIAANGPDIIVWQENDND